MAHRSLSPRRSIRLLVTLMALVAGLLVAPVTGSGLSGSSVQAASATKTAKISGTVRSEGGKRLAGVRVEAVRVKGGGLSRVTTDAKGRYTTRKLPPGRYKVRVYTWTIGNYAERHKTVVLKAKRTKKLDVALARGGVVTGVVRSDGGDPLAGVRVDLRSAKRGIDVPGSGTTTTDATGRYRFERLRTAPFTISVHGPSGFASHGQKVSAKARKTTRLDVGLETLGSVTGRVTDELTGDAVPGAVVGVATSGGRLTTAGADGRFRLSDLRRGSRRLLVKAGTTNHAPRYVDVMVQPGTAVTSDVALTVGARAQGRITYPSGRSYAAGDFVSFISADSGISITTDLEAGGRYQVQGLGPGTHRVDLTELDHDGTGWTVGSLDVVPGETTTRDLVSDRPFLRTAPFVITGRRAVGSTLRADRGRKWWPEPTVRTYQWYRDGTPIPGAVNRRYTLRKADRGARIRVAVTGSRPDYRPATARSSATGAIKKAR